MTPRGLEADSCSRCAQESDGSLSVSKQASLRAVLPAPAAVAGAHQDKEAEDSMHQIQRREKRPRPHTVPQKLEEGLGWPHKH